MRKATLIAALFLLTPTVSQAKTLEELLVEKGVITKGEAAGSTSAAASKVYWNNGTRVDFPDTGFTTTIATQLQTRYTFSDNDESVGEQNTSSFDVHRARLIVSGTALNKEFSYRLSTDFIGGRDTDNPDSPAVRDAYIQWQPCLDDLGVRLGAFKTGISRQFNTDQSALQFVDRSTASEYFTLGRQNGAALMKTFADGMVEASAAIFNGSSTFEGPNQTGVDTLHTGVASVRINPMGKMNAYEEGDLDYTEDAALSLGAAYAYGEANDNSADPFNSSGNGSETNTINVDANLKYQGLSVAGEYFHQNVNLDQGSDVSPSGFYAQAGYFLTPKKLELAARYGYTDCDNGNASGVCAGYDSISEAAATINYFFWRNSLKAQLGYSHQSSDQTDTSASDVKNNRYVFQLSSYF
jgi:phosphate-selective porin